MARRRGSERNRSDNGVGGPQPIVKPRIDWSALKTRYVTGDETFDSLSDAVGVNRSRLAVRASGNGWVKAREKFRADVARKATKQAERYRIRTEVELNRRTHGAAFLAIKRAETLINRVPGGDARQLKAAVDALTVAVGLARKSAGLAEDPAPGENAPDDGVIRIRRKAPDGTVVELEVPGATGAQSQAVDVGGNGADGNRPDGLHADGDAVEVLAGPDASAGALGRPGFGEDEDGSGGGG